MEGARAAVDRDGVLPLDAGGDEPLEFLDEGPHREPLGPEDLEEKLFFEGTDVGAAEGDFEMVGHGVIIGASGFGG
jgi:hypothetical protein